MPDGRWRNVQILSQLYWNTLVTVDMGGTVMFQIPLYERCRDLTHSGYLGKGLLRSILKY